MLKKLIKIIQFLEYRKLIIYRMIHWYMIGFRQYNKSKHFKAPEVKNGTPEYSKMLLDYYENGIVEIPTDNFEELNANFLESIQSLFEESICIYDSTPLKDKIERFFDKRGRLWEFNNAAGILRLQIADPEHPLYTEQCNIYEGCGKVSPYTMTDAFSEYSYLKKILELPIILKLADYANFGDIKPISIKIERKTYTTQKGKYDEHYTHLDTSDISTFKYYVYLNDVDTSNGPIAISKGSHHWKRYPHLLKYIKIKDKYFPLAKIKQLKIPPILPFYGKAGTTFGFTGNAVHNATNVEKEKERWTIQVYYYSKTIWASDKR